MHSLRTFLHRLKPGVPRQVHLLLAACLWTAVGLGLMLRGVVWLMEGDTLILLLPAILLGSLKSLFLLDKSARKSIDRIQLLADGSCLGAVYSVKTWLVVLVMMSSGYIMRHSGVSISLLGILYVTIGWALLFSSRAAWRAWRKA